MTETSTRKEDVFMGFEHPKENWSKIPHTLIEAMPNITSLGEMKVILYLLRHTWGFQDIGEFKKITLDEFAKGRKRKDRSRYDSGTGLSIPTIRKGLKQAIDHGFILIETDNSDKARQKNYYMLKMADGPDVENSLPPECKNLSPRLKESLPRTEKDTIERNSKKDTLSAIAEVEPSTPIKGKTKPQSSLPDCENLNKNGKPLSEHQQYYGALSLTFDFDIDMMTKESQGRMNVYAKQVRAGGYSLEDIRKAKFLWPNRWPGKTGSSPYESEFTKCLKIAREERVKREGRYG